MHPRARLCDHCDFLAYWYIGSILDKENVPDYYCTNCKLKMPEDLKWEVLEVDNTIETLEAFRLGGLTSRIVENGKYREWYYATPLIKEPDCVEA